MARPAGARDLREHRRRRPAGWAVCAGLGALVVVTGWLPPAEARTVAVTRAGPVLAFLAAVTALAALADDAGVFDAAAGLCARAGGGSVPRLFLLVAAIAVTVTIGMSLDTTAVLLTPVVLALTLRLGLRPLPFALLVVWLANTASLALPISNLTNLLAVGRPGAALSTATFATRMLLPEIASVTVTVAFLGLLFRADLRGRYAVPAPRRVPDRPLALVCALACAALAPAVVLGLPPWTAALPAAVACAAATLLRHRPVAWRALVPWRLLALTVGLFLVVTALGRHGLDGLFAYAAGTSPLQTAAVGAAASNPVNNLPAYLALERAVPVGPAATDRLLALLIGTDAGPLVLLWGSLATLLWRERCRARGLQVGAVEFARVGLVGVPLVVLAAVGALRLTG